MAKLFAKRIPKRDRRVKWPKKGIDENVFQVSDDKLLRGAILEEVDLSKIRVREQVRTKFVDSSIKELAENIKINGLIQPLVIHQDPHGYRLICGERRYRAMSSIKTKKAPCFILQDKSEEELMAIQFSENTAREELHYIDKANGILGYQKATGASERKIQKALGISKSEVHRGLIMAKLPNNIKEAAKTFNIEKYVLIEFDGIRASNLKRLLQEKILGGHLRKRSELKKVMADYLKVNEKTLSEVKKTSNRAAKPMRKKKVGKKGRSSRSNEIHLPH